MVPGLTSTINRIMPIMTVLLVQWLQIFTLNKTSFSTRVMYVNHHFGLSHDQADQRP